MRWRPSGRGIELEVFDAIVHRPWPCARAADGLAARGRGPQSLHSHFFMGGLAVSHPALLERTAALTRRQHLAERHVQGCRFRGG